MSELIKFRTSSGTVFQRRANDPMVTTILSMYDEVGIPSVVELSGSVGEIVDEEYTHLERLLKRRELLQGEVMTRAMQELLNTIQEATRFHYEDGRLRSVGIVYLNRVSRIIRVFDVDDDLINFTVVDGATSLDDRLRHYQLLGSEPTVKKAIDAIRLDATSPLYSMKLARRSLDANNTNQFADYTFMSMIAIQSAAIQANAGKVPYSTELFRLLFDYASEQEEDEARLTELLYGILTNGLIRATHEGTTLATQLIWEDLLEIMKDVELMRDVRNTINFFAGKASHGSELLTLVVLPYTHTMFTYDAPLILSRGLALIPEDASPQDIGITTLLDGRTIHYQKLAYTPETITQQVMNSAIQIAKSNTKEVAALVSQLGELIGRRAIVRVLLSLLHHLESNPSDEEADRVAQAIEAHLG